ncbi:MAG: hypothetical protein AAGN35_01390 [Bacteroidota bacterium]
MKINISIKQMRATLPSDAEVSDIELDRLRRWLYEVARIYASTVNAAL